MNKKKNILRIIIYTVIAFLPVCVLCPILYGGEMFIAKSEKGAAIAYLCGFIAMLIPTISQIITRIVTGEGFCDNKLMPMIFENSRRYIRSIYLPVIMAVAQCGIVCILVRKSPLFISNGIGIAVFTYLLQLLFALFTIFAAFGEEWGFRGYLMPKLLKVMPKPLALVCGGLIWGVWYIPLVCAGYNYGAGSVMIRIAFMLASCIFMNVVYTYFTEKTGSVFPCVIFSSVRSQAGITLMCGLFLSQEANIKIASMSSMYIAILAVECIAAAVCFVKMIRQK